MLESILQAPIAVRGNHPLLLDAPDKVWFVASGCLSLFATQVQGGQAEGTRHYLFSATEGDILFGTTPDGGMGLLAVALDESQLRPIALTDFLTRVSEGESEAIAGMEGWFRHFRAVFSPRPDGETSDRSLQFDSFSLSLEPGQILQPPASDLVWLEIGAGRALWLGSEEIVLDRNSPRFPFGPGMWIEAIESLEIHARYKSHGPDVAGLVAGITFSQQLLSRYLEIRFREERSARFQRFLGRERLTNQIYESALDRLTALVGLDGTEASPFPGISPLLAAVGALGRVQGIAIQPPDAAEESESIGMTLEAIARASRFRCRRATLTGEWWRSEHGPLLGFRLPGNQPIALLSDRHRRGTYTLFDPAQNTHEPVTAEIARTLSPKVYLFYRPLPGRVRNGLELFWYGIRGYHGDFLLIVLLGVIGAGLGMLTPAVTQTLIDQAIPDGDRSLLLQIGFVLLVAAFGQTAFQLSQGIVTLRVEKVADANLQLTVWDRLLQLPPSFFRRYASGDLVNRLFGIRDIRGQLSGATLRTLLSGIFSLLNLGLMFLYSAPLALVGAGLSLVAVLITVLSSLLIIRKERQGETLEGAIYGLTVQLLGGIPKIRVAGAEERAFAAWSEKYSRRTRLTRDIKSIDDSLTTLNEALPLLSSALMFWFATVFLQSAAGNEGKLTMGTFLAFNTAFATYLGGMIGLSNTLTDILRIVPIWERSKVIVQSLPESNPGQTHPGRLQGRVVLDRVSFRYRPDGLPTLDQVSISAEPGEFIALVGPSGSGKSTVFRLLLGFESPQSGTVYYDGQDLAKLEVTAVRRQLGVVLQNGRVQQNSIYENISGGALVSLDEAWEAARMAGFAEDIEQMPMGMHTIINEGGSNLSGGQRQRLLIARALVHRPKIILMDEATSALDNRTQAIVTESLEKLKTTRIVIAHRLSTIRHADRIYVIDSGRVVQDGSFEELMREEGLFARLIARQLE
jgi:NHLM bacteriocin system ABC transporter ATP-binding protein